MSFMPRMCRAEVFKKAAQTARQGASLSQAARMASCISVVNFTKCAAPSQPTFASMPINDSFSNTSFALSGLTSTATDVEGVQDDESGGETGSSLPRGKKRKQRY